MQTAPEKKHFLRLSNKLKRKKDEDERGESEKNPPRKNAHKKTMRKVEMGWMNYDNTCGIFKQVRTKRGGGTRKVDVCKDAVKKDLIKLAMDLFFPSGRNAEGAISDFHFDLRDFKQITLNDDTTVGKLYNDTGLTLLRFYPSSKKTTDGELHQSEDEETIVHQPTPSLGSAAIPHTSQEEAITVEDADFETIAYADIGLDVENDMDDSNIVYVSTGTISDHVEEDLDDTLPISP